MNEPWPETIHIEVFGTLTWNDDYVAWFGAYNGFRFLLDYSDKTGLPHPAVVAYAKSVLDQPRWLNEQLSAAKWDYLKDIRAPEFVKEVNALTFGVLHFQGDEKSVGIFAHLDGGRDFRSWRIEFDGNTCFGIGFDS